MGVGGGAPSFNNSQDEADYNSYYSGMSNDQKFRDYMQYNRGTGLFGGEMQGPLMVQLLNGKRAPYSRAAQHAITTARGTRVANEEAAAAAKKAADEKAAADKAAADRAAAQKAVADRDAAAKQQQQSNPASVWGAGSAPTNVGAQAPVGTSMAPPMASSIGFGRGLGLPQAASSTGMGSGFVDTSGKDGSLAGVFSNAVGSAPRSGRTIF